MQVIEFDKNSEEWLEWRTGKSGGSRAAKLIPSPRLTKALAELTPPELGEYKASLPKKDEFYRLVAEAVARPITPNDYTDRLPEGVKFSMMERGHILEPEAIAAFEAKTGKKVLQRSVAWVSDYNEKSILTPDGEISDEEAVEVKCPDSHVMIRAYHENQYPQEYKWQAVKYFSTNEKLKKLNFVLYTDVIPSLPILIFEINREDIIDQIDEYRAFESSIIKQANELIEELSF